MDKVTLNNYPDAKCTYGYMTVCTLCLPKAPWWVDTRTVVKGCPAVRCEMCKRKYTTK